jgi:hypothetical protein
MNGDDDDDDFLFYFIFLFIFPSFLKGMEKKKKINQHFEIRWN